MPTPQALVKYSVTWGKKFCCRQVSQSSQLLDRALCSGLRRKLVPNQSKVLLKSPLGSSLAVALNPELASEEQRSVLFAGRQHKPQGTTGSWEPQGGLEERFLGQSTPVLSMGDLIPEVWGYPKAEG